MSNNAKEPNEQPDESGDSTQPENDGQHYYSYALTGAYSGLNFLGSSPLFVLKDAWDNKPRNKNKPSNERYHLLIDPRARLQLILNSQKDLLRSPHAIVEWIEPPVKDKGKQKQVERSDSEEPNPGLSQNSQAGLDFTNHMAFLHADIAGWTEDNEEGEALSIYSSDNEELGTEEEEPPIKIYYPLFRTATKCDAKTRKTLQKIAQCDENGPYAELRDLAAQMLAELQRVDDIPLVMG